MKNRLEVIILVVLGLSLVGGGLAISRKQAKNLEEGIILETTTSRHEGIVVDVSGAVERPGVYKLPDDSRKQDALITAGGLGAKADRNYVAKYINMAQKLVDGEKVYIPEIGDQNSPNADFGLNINTATLSELDNLPGIGAITAEKIINGRPYQNISNLVEKKIVSQGIFDKIRTRLSVY